MFLKKVVPHATEAITKTKLSKWCPPSAEALLFVLLENNYDQWMWDRHLTEPMPTPLYTERARSGYKYQGWSQAGIDRYNKIMDHVELCRKNDAKEEAEDDDYESLEMKLLREAKKVLKDVKKRKCVHVQKEKEKRPKCSMPKNFAFWDQPEYEGDKENFEEV